MQAAEILAVLALISVAFAGFSGIVVALRRRIPGEWGDLDAFRLRFMIEFSLATLLPSLLPFFLAEFVASELLVWRISSLVLGALAVFYSLRFALRLDRLIAIGEPVSRGLAVAISVVGVAVAASSLANAAGYFERPAGVYLAGLGGCLFVTSAMFGRLVLTASAPE